MTWRKCGHLRIPENTCAVSLHRPGGKCRICVSRRLARYNGSEKGRARKARYVGSEKGRATMARYTGSEKGRARKARYANSMLGFLSIERGLIRRRGMR